MFSAVVRAELVRAARRGRAHVLVWLYAGWLVVQLLYVWSHYHSDARHQPTPSDAAAFGRSFIDLVLGQQFVLLALVAPAFAAGAIAEEKSRGTLQYLLITQFTSADIVLGKLIARVVQVGVLALVPLPLVALVGPYAGLTPEFLVIWLAVGALLVAGICAVSVLASVWAKQPRNAVLLAYALLAAPWLLHGLPFDLPFHLDAWSEVFDPLRPLGPALDRADTAEAFRRLGAFAAAWAGLGLAAAALAVWRMAPAYLRQLEARPRRFRFVALGGRPRPRDDALAWKECHIGRRVPLWIGMPLVALAAGWGTYAAVGAPFTFMRPPQVDNLMAVGWGALIALTVYVGVRASGSICGERERQTWDGLLTTPLTEREIVRGKAKGILKSAMPYVATTALTVIVTTVVVAPSAFVGVFLLTLFAVLVICLAMYFLTAAGLYCSARSRSSWRSLLATLSIGYLGGYLLFCVSLPLSCLSLGLLWALAELFAQMVVRDPYTGGPTTWMVWGVFGPLFWFFGSAVVYWWACRRLLAAAEKRIAQHDRTRGRLAGE